MGWLERIIGQSIENQRVAALPPRPTVARDRSLRGKARIKARKAAQRAEKAAS